jgi:hypothetical protein
MNENQLHQLVQLTPEDKVVIYFSSLAFLTDSFKSILEGINGDKRSSSLVDELANSSVEMSLHRHAEMTEEEKSQMSNLAMIALVSLVKEVKS